MPNQENIPKTINKSWNNANKANNAYFLSNLMVIYKDIANKETNNEVTQLVSNLFPSFGPINLESLLS